MSATLQVEVVTPEKIMFKGDAEMVEAPGQEGDFGVLPEHSPFVSLLKPGVVKIHSEGKEQRLFVTAGLAQVENNRCVVLAENVHEPDALTSDDTQKMLKEAQRKRDKCEKETEEYNSACKEVRVLERLCEVVEE